MKYNFKVIKNGPSKICGRQPLKNFTWSILECCCLQISITVTDENDNQPRFATDRDSVVISPKRNSIGFIIYTLAATDLDVGINARIVYSSLMLPGMK